VLADIRPVIPASFVRKSPGTGDKAEARRRVVQNIDELGQLMVADAQILNGIDHIHIKQAG
jgi:hypothetical protein